MKNIILKMSDEEISILKIAVEKIRANGFLLQPIMIRGHEMFVSAGDFAEVIARAEKTLENEMILYRLRREALKQLDPASLEYYVLAGVKIGYKSKLPPRELKPIPLFS